MTIDLKTDIFSIYRKLKIGIGMTSVYTETSKSIPVFFRYIPKLQNPYRYFFGIYRNFKIHTDIFSVYTETSKSIPIFFGIYRNLKNPYRYFSVSYHTEKYRYFFGIGMVSIYPDKYWNLNFFISFNNGCMVKVSESWKTSTSLGVPQV